MLQQWGIWEELGNSLGLNLGRGGGEVDKRRRVQQSKRGSDLATRNNVNVAKSVTAVATLKGLAVATQVG